MRHASLRVRLFASYAVVAVVGAIVLVVVSESLAPQLFDHHVAGMGFGRGRLSGAAPLHDAFRSALTRSLVAAVTASLLAAAVAAVLVTRRLVRPLNGIAAAARHLAAGHYDDPIPAPSEPELAALVGDINTLSAELSASEHRRAALIGDVAHEMRTPLTTIRGYMDGLADGIFTAEEAAAAVNDEVSRLHRLAADLAAVSRAEEGTLALTRSAVDLAEVAGAAAARLRPQYDERGITLITGVDQPAEVFGDRDRLLQAATNLIGNALAYTDPGGTVEVGVTAAAGTATLIVKDDGAGLAPTDLERVFERFYRVDRGRHSSGTGVGLTIARAVARAHGGDVTASSRGIGHGSTFTLTIPTP